MSAKSFMLNIAVPALWLVPAFLVAKPLTVLITALLLLLFILPGWLLRPGWLVDSHANWWLWIAQSSLFGFWFSTMVGVGVLLLLPAARWLGLVIPPLAALILAFRSRRRGVARLPARPPCREFLALALLCGVMIALVIKPLATIGYPLPEGQAFRAYFNVDYLKHVAVTAHLSHADVPPDNPYLKSGESFHYYWFYYVFPALVHAAFPKVAGSVLDILRVVHLWTNCCFVLLLFGFLRTLSDRLNVMVLPLGCSIAASSYEGAYLVRKIMLAHKPLIAGIGDYNVDAATRWFIGHPQIDCWYRMLLYTPQHLFALALLCMAVLALVWLQRNELLTTRRLFGLGCFTATIFGFSSFLGLAASFWWVIAGGVAALPRRRISLLAAAWLSQVPVYAGFLALGIFFRRPDSLIFAPQYQVLHQLPLFFALNFGPLLLLLPVGIFKGFRYHRFLAFNLMVLLTFSVGLTLFAQIPNFPSDVGLKLGLIIFFALVLFGALALVPTRSLLTRCLAPAMILLMIPAVPTVIMDAMNSSDISNRTFTTMVENGDLQACAWIRENLPAPAIIQSDPSDRSAAMSIIPTFAERRTAVGDDMHARIFLSNDEQYQRARKVIASMFASSTPAEALQAMKQAAVDYVLVGSTERLKYPGIEKVFDNFVCVYRHEGVALYAAQLLACLALQDSGSGNQFPAQSLSVIVTSQDPSHAHTFEITAQQTLLEGTEPSKPWFTARITTAPMQQIVMQVPAGEESATSKEAKPRIRLYHLLDQEDLEKISSYPALTLFQECHTTGVAESPSCESCIGAKTGRDQAGILLGKNFGVLGPGQYRLHFEGSDESSVPPESIRLRTARNASDLGSSKELALTVVNEREAAFDLTDFQQVELLLWFDGVQSLTLRSVNLLWQAWKPSSIPLADKEASW